jgi:hypothetical protein
MTQWGGTVVVATEFAVFRLIGGALVPIPFLSEEIKPLEPVLPVQSKGWMGR